MTPLGMSLATFQGMPPNRVFERQLVNSALSQVMLDLACLHEADIIHSGMSTEPQTRLGWLLDTW